MDELFIKYGNPVIVDNRMFRKKIPIYNKYFDKVKHELSGLPCQEKIMW